MLKSRTLISISIALLLLLSAQAKAEDESKKNAVFVTAMPLFTIEFAHSNPTYDFAIFNIGYERRMASWWSLGFSFDPIIGWSEFDNAYGYGGSLVWTAYFDRGSQITPFVTLSAGAAYFNKEVPVVRSSRLNFPLSFRVGIDYDIGGSNSLIIGYAFGHISNSAIGERNPGINGHAVVFGLRHAF